MRTQIGFGENTLKPRKIGEEKKEKENNHTPDDTVETPRKKKEVD